MAIYRATAHAVRDRLIEQWNDTQQYWTEQDPKRVYYLSLEYLIGRCLQNHLINLDLQPAFAQATRTLGFQLEEVADQEQDPALGNGGLGRLASCFLDSLATLNYAAWGYGIRYQYGMFKQIISPDGQQQEVPDFWLTQGNPWEIERLDVTYPVRFYGSVVTDSSGRKYWTGGEVVQAVAYDLPIPGFDTYNVANLRLWAARPGREFDLAAFNEGNYMEAINSRQRAEQISSVLYPNDNSTQGKELRLKQQYFFVSATLRDILRRFRKVPRKWSELKDKVAIQLNDTHPTIGIPELMRILVDEEKVEWSEAWDITRHVYAYTNHTVLPEALERWSVGLLEHLLPRHLEIIYEINFHFLNEVRAVFGEDNYTAIQRLSLVEEGPDKKIRMANLGIVGSHAVNGVAAIHSEILKTDIFPEFYRMFPERFQNKTNGVTPRRWLLAANPNLAKILTNFAETSEWVVNLELLTRLREHANNPELHAEIANVKRRNKERLAEYIRATMGVDLDPSALFDIQIKRIHEYKRQFMNILACCRRYLDLKKMSAAELADVVPRVTIIGGKAAPGYWRAKSIIHFINQVAHIVNNDTQTNRYFKLVFVPNYNVSSAEVLIPAADLSQHISTAGTEASGTSNMKFAMNGCLIIGTWDGANVEISEEIGAENMFMFGKRANEVTRAREDMQLQRVPLASDLKEVIVAVRQGTFGNPSAFASLIDSLENGTDHYLVGADWEGYLDAQRQVEEKFKNQSAWLASSILSIAGSGKFSTDRTITQYAEEIWGIKPCARSLEARKAGGSLAPTERATVKAAAPPPPPAEEQQQPKSRKKWGK
eukprot:c19038_g1_i2.p1 GENE.c19038_g1_i2~~c19038_g1_i2.p1  ORF type:complete len:929 (+),score=256.99 c19038_g1_i2:318-2789(+)